MISVFGSQTSPRLTNSQSTVRGEGCPRSGESARRRGGSRPWWRRWRSEGRRRGWRWLRPNARRRRDGRRRWRRKPAVRARAASVRLAALVAVGAGRRTVEHSSAVIADPAAVGSTARWRTRGSGTVGTTHTQVVHAGPPCMRADGVAIRCSAAAVVYGATVAIAILRFAWGRRAHSRRAAADVVFASPAGWAIIPAIQRAAASVADAAAIIAELWRRQTDVGAWELAGQLGADVRRTDADVVVTNPASLRACGRAMKCASTPVADVAAIVKEAIRTGPWRAHLRPADTYVVLADPPSLRTEKRARERATASVADVAAVLRFVRRIHTTETCTDGRRPGADVVLASPSRSWAGFSTIEGVATTVADRSAEPIPVLVCAGDCNAGVASGICCSVHRIGIGRRVRRVGRVRRARQVSHADIRGGRIGVPACIRAPGRGRILAGTPGV